VESGHSGGLVNQSGGVAIVAAGNLRQRDAQRRNRMTIPQWALLAFAVWTLLVLFGTVGVYRWSRILKGQVPISAWQADQSQGSEWYRRAMRAHVNCVENLPVFGAIVYCAAIAGARGNLLDTLALTVVAGRIGQTTVHLSVTQTNAAASLRFSFFLLQVLSMFGMAALAARTAAPF
jgi:uncharacterized MAPEG superfamily protein